MSGKRSRAFRAYQKIKTLRPARSLFDLSHDVIMTADMFKLYPVCAMEMSPGDTFHIWNESVTRMQPLNAPILSEIKQNTHYFFVPYRILWEYWTNFITGGEKGQFGGDYIGLSDSDHDLQVDGDIGVPDVLPSIPLWKPSNTGVGSLWDYFGLPVGINYLDEANQMCPVDFLRRAYNMIWNEYYRDENLQAAVPLTNEEVLYRNWKKDYFTSALLNQQRGVSPVMPVNVSANLSQNYIKFIFDNFSNANNIIFKNTNTGTLYFGEPNPSMITAKLRNSTTGQIITRQYVYSSRNMAIDVNLYYKIVGEELDVSKYSIEETNSYVDVHIINTSVGQAEAGFDTKDLRQAFQIQKWLELANRGGVRYTEFLRAFFGVSPRDDRLQRPEYIGGSSSNIVVSEVLQTNAAVQGSTPLAYMAGHGLGAERTYIGSYSASEYGILIGLMSYTTPPVYAQGINRQWLRRTKFDFLFPQFTGLSEQAITGAEVFATGKSVEDRKVWGFNEVYDELRAMTSKVVGKMRTVFSYWHLARIFSTKPSLNSDFISGKDVSKRIFAVPSEEGFIVHYANIIRALRPLPKYGTPKGV